MTDFCWIELCGALLFCFDHQIIKIIFCCSHPFETAWLKPFCYPCNMLLHFCYRKKLDGKILDIIGKKRYNYWYGLMSKL